MARSDLDKRVQLSVLDRLIDRDPASRSEEPMSRSESLREYKAAVRRDLEWLLNTRRTPVAAPEDFRELQASVYHYGLPDISALTVDSVTDQAKLLRSLEAVILCFEPRLQNVTIQSLAPLSKDSRSLRFLIQGMLRMDPAPEPVSFDTVLELASGEYHVKGA